MPISRRGRRRLSAILIGTYFESSAALATALPAELTSLPAPWTVLHAETPIPAMISATAKNFRTMGSSSHLISKLTNR